MIVWKFSAEHLWSNFATKLNPKKSREQLQTPCWLMTFGIWVANIEDYHVMLVLIISYLIHPKLLIAYIASIYESCTYFLGLYGYSLCILRILKCRTRIPKIHGLSSSKIRIILFSQIILTWYNWYNLVYVFFSTCFATCSFCFRISFWHSLTWSNLVYVVFLHVNTC